MKVNPHEETGLHCMEGEIMDINAPFDGVSVLFLPSSKNYIPKTCLFLCWLIPFPKTTVPQPSNGELTS